MSNTNQHIGESKIFSTPEKAFKIKLKDGSISSAKLAKNAVTKDKIADESVTVHKLSSSLTSLISAATGLSSDILVKLEDCIENIKSIPQIYIGETAPENTADVWVDETGISLDSEEGGIITAIQKQLNALNVKVNRVLKIVDYGAVPGNASNSARKDAMASSTTALEPVVDEETGELTEGDETMLEPDTSDYTYTVPSVNAKVDTSVNFAKPENRQNLTDGELVFFTDYKMIKVYYQGSFYGSGDSGSGAGSGSGGGLSLDQLYSSKLEYLVFKAGDDTYKVKILSDGTLVYSKYNKKSIEPGSPDSKWLVYISQYLNINTVFCGGDNTTGCSCSHNFVEIANGSNKDINLNGIMLLYTDNSKAGIGADGFAWKVLPLEGYIKAHSTYLIRGGRCNTDKASFIAVKDFDIEWYDGNDLIRFSQTTSSFYLAVGDSESKWVYDNSGKLVNKSSLTSPWIGDSTKINVGYIDSCGFGNQAVGEGTALTPNVSDNWSDCMFVRWFTFEPAQQGNKDYVSRSTASLWTYINLKKQTTVPNASNIKYYYPDWRKKLYAPKSSREHKDFFTNKTLMDENKPNILNITFGIQATSDSTNNIKASRCFNWVSVGYYDEFLEYRKKGTSEWTKVYSITAGDYRNPAAINKYINHYQRLRWVTSNGTWVTTHKVILSGVFEKGEYEYRVGRDNDSQYVSDILSFRVWDASEVSNFSFIQTSDQQGFNWIEYQAWKKSAYCIKNTETGAKDYCFTVNTGDITQSGNRENEWLDYYDGRQYLRDKEEMFTIGNNDLCGYDASELTDGKDSTSKYNHINVLRYYTFELDVNNEPKVAWNDIEYPIYSLYSYNFGDYHFVCLNSETAKASSKTYVLEDGDGDESFAKATNAAIEDWFKKDLQIWKNVTTDPTNCSKAIVYCHEMPFTMVTYTFMSNTSKAREGSHLNTLNNNGNYRFSRLFKKYGIRLVIGGHKHTYTISKPIYDAPTGYLNSAGKIVEGVDLMGTVDGGLSRKPVIQVLNNNEVLTSNYARYEKVIKIDAPTYVMSQATGYKLVSNREMPAPNPYTIPWLLHYFKQNGENDTNSSENLAQHFPMYIRYDLSDTTIKVTAKQITGIWNIDTYNNKKEYDFNNQMESLSTKSMTLDKGNDKESYTITL